MNATGFREGMLPLSGTDINHYMKSRFNPLKKECFS
ncbi:MAG: hypothetical protein BWY31_00869 [Lentisphaerae bacterium ADurb.Bin242]|nr:MAG: hypothetical protein BWY31_00869 [Lentisphaerae bacterium ADurb.Bin242]